MTDTRERIAGRIRADPGVHFSELVRVLDLAPGQVQYHLHRLRGSDAVVAGEHFGRTHYYPPSFDAAERRTMAALRRETAAAIAGVLAENGPRRPADVAETVGIARSTLAHHVERLVEVGVVERRRTADGRVTLALADVAATVALLDRADPTVGDRLVDRFTRLVDALLAESG